MSKEEELRKAISKADWGDHIVKLCSTPRSTSEIRKAWEEWSSGIIGFGISLEDTLKNLEHAEVIKYAEGKWQSTKEA